MLPISRREILFGVIDAVPTARNPSIGMNGPTSNYTTRLNIVFLVLAALFVWRFFTAGGRARLAAMGGGPDDMSTHEIGGTAVSIDLARAGGLGTITNSPFPSNRVTANV